MAGIPTAPTAKARAATAKIPYPYYPTSSKFPDHIVNKPNSEMADSKGLREGKLIVQSRKKVEKLEGIQKKLAYPVEITCFENWGATQSRILLYAKPTTCSEVQKLVQAVIDLKDEEGKPIPLKVVTNLKID